MCQSAVWHVLVSNSGQSVRPSVGWLVGWLVVGARRVIVCCAHLF